jgi:hypothetical protein
MPHAFELPHPCDRAITFRRTHVFDNDNGNRRKSNFGYLDLKRAVGKENVGKASEGRRRRTDLAEWNSGVLGHK